MISHGGAPLLLLQAVAPVFLTERLNTLKKLRHIDVAALYLFIWLAVQMFFSFLLPAWASFSTIFACTLPIVALARKGAFGARDTNARRFPKRDYIWFALFFVSGCAFVSFCTSLTIKMLGGDLPSNPGSFLYRLVFACLLPAFFEEWLFRGHILRICSVYGGVGVILAGLFFGFAHLSVARLPYAVFAGIMLSAIVYLTENIYLGMAFHALTNFTSLCLSRVRGNSASAIAIGAIIVVFCISAFHFWRSSIGEKMLRLFRRVWVRDVFATLSPLAILYFLVTTALIVFNSL